MKQTGVLAFDYCMEAGDQKRNRNPKGAIEINKNRINGHHANFQGLSEPVRFYRSRRLTDTRALRVSCLPSVREQIAMHASGMLLSLGLNHFDSNTGSSILRLQRRAMQSLPNRLRSKYDGTYKTSVHHLEFLVIACKLPPVLQARNYECDC